MMYNSLRHVTRVVSFMTFDVESQHTLLGLEDNDPQLVRRDSDVEGASVFVDN